MTRSIAQPAGARADERHEQMTRVIDELHGATRLLRCAATGRLVKQGVSMTQVHVLWLLDEHGELPMSRIAELLDVSLSNATGLMDRMEEHGLVERVRVPDDRRVVRVRIAPTGRTVLDEIQIVRDDLARAVLERLDDEQLARLKASLRDFRAAIRAEADARPGLFEAFHRHPHEHEGEDPGQ